MRLAVNSGQQSALLAGLDHVEGQCDVSVTIDADLQDDLDAIGQMLDRYVDGFQIVLGVKLTRKSDAFLKRATASLFYKAMRVLGVGLQAQHSDFRLLSSKAMRNLRQFPERNLFLRGFPKKLHSKVATVEYHIKEREAGETKFQWTQMISLALDGVTSFSIAPLRLITLAGFLIFLFSSLFALYAVTMFSIGETVPGWASIVIPVYLLGGAIMLSIGILGEYIGKNYIETKGRPRYLVDEVIDPSAQGKSQTE